MEIWSFQDAIEISKADIKCASRDVHSARIDSGVQVGIGDAAKTAKHPSSITRHHTTVKGSRGTVAVRLAKI